MAIYLVRHGHAGTRAKWDDDDRLRPLSKKGASQALYLDELLGDRPIRRVYSSPSLRCIETIEPLASRLHIDVKTHAALDEGADPVDAIAFALGRAKHDPVMCTHGDLIPKVIRRLIAEGMCTHDANISQKGSVWEIEVNRGQAARAVYHPPGLATA